jgi:hypothetical protein
MMTLRNGKFFKNGDPYPIEFGNNEQIKLIDSVKKLKEHGLTPGFIFDEEKQFICGIYITCVCGSKVSCNWETEEEAYAIEGIRLKCPGCDFTFVVCTDEDNSVFLKIHV